MTDFLTGTAAEASTEGLGGEFAGFPAPYATDAKIEEAASRLTDAFSSRDPRAAIKLREAITTADFQSAVSVVLDRETITQYQELPSAAAQYTAETTVSDFKPKMLDDLVGGAPVLPVVPEGTEYPHMGMPGREEYQIRVAKRGGRYRLTFEKIINGDWINDLITLPNRLAQSARATDSFLAASLLTDGDGPASWFGTPADYALTTNSLDAALQVMAVRPYPAGVPVGSQRFALVVPPALETTARRILGASEIRTTQGRQTVIQANYLTGAVDLVVEPYLQVQDTGAKAATTWYLVPSPTAPRKSLFLAKLRGYEQPELRVKADTGTYVGGGNIPAEQGNFLADLVEYRVRYIRGAAVTLTRDLWASTGGTAHPDDVA